MSLSAFALGRVWACSPRMHMAKASVRIRLCQRFRRSSCVRAWNLPACICCKRVDRRLRNMITLSETILWVFYVKSIRSFKAKDLIKRMDVFLKPNMTSSMMFKESINADWHACRLNGNISPIKQ